MSMSTYTPGIRPGPQGNPIPARHIVVVVIILVFAAVLLRQGLTATEVAGLITALTATAALLIRRIGVV